MKNNRKTIIKKVLRECIPTVFSLMLLSMYTVIDGLFVGNYAGDIGLAGINIAWPITAFIIAIGVGIGVGCSVLIAFSRGKDDVDGCKLVLQIGLTMLIISAVILMLVLFPMYKGILTLFKAEGDVFVEASKYANVVICGALAQVVGSGIIPILRSFGMSISAMVCMITGTVVNLIANYILICLLDMGVKGAGLGTVIAQSVVCFISLILLVKNSKIKLAFKLNSQIVRRIMSVGITGFGVSMAPSITLIFANIQCFIYGGDSCVACYAVIAYVAWPIQSMLSGVGEGTQPLMSYYCGADDNASLKITSNFARWFAVGLSILMTALIFVLTPYLASWFGLSSQGSLMFDSGMLIYAISFIIVSMSRFNVCYLNATLKCKKARVLTYIESLVVSPLLLVLLPLVFKIDGIWLSYLVTAVVMVVIYAVTQRRDKGLLV